jgi:hypothetical protein
MLIHEGFNEWLPILESLVVVLKNLKKLRICENRKELRAPSFESLDGLVFKPVC